jgi:hypothetical protein
MREASEGTERTVEASVAGRVEAFQVCLPSSEMDIQLNDK